MVENMDENSKTVTNKVREKRRRNNSNLFYIQSFLILVGIVIQSILHGFESGYTLPLVAIFLLTIAISALQEMGITVDVKGNKHKNLVVLSVTFAILAIIFLVLYLTAIKTDMTPLVFFVSVYGSLIVVFAISVMIVLKKYLTNKKTQSKLRFFVYSFI